MAVTLTLNIPEPQAGPLGHAFGLHRLVPRRLSNLLRPPPGTVTWPEDGSSENTSEDEVLPGDEDPGDGVIRSRPKTESTRQLEGGNAQPYREHGVTCTTTTTNGDIEKDSFSVAGSDVSPVTARGGLTAQGAEVKHGLEARRIDDDASPQPPPSLQVDTDRRSNRSSPDIGKANAWACRVEPPLTPCSSSVHASDPTSPSSPIMITSSVGDGMCAEYLVNTPPQEDARGTQQPCNTESANENLAAAIASVQPMLEIEESHRLRVRKLLATLGERAPPGRSNLFFF